MSAICKQFSKSHAGRERKGERDREDTGGGGMTVGESGQRDYSGSL